LDRKLFVVDICEVYVHIELFLIDDNPRVTLLCVSLIIDDTDNWLKNLPSRELFMNHLKHFDWFRPTVLQPIKSQFLIRPGISCKSN